MVAAINLIVLAKFFNVVVINYIFVVITFKIVVRASFVRTLIALLVMVAIYVKFVIYAIVKDAMVVIYAIFAIAFVVSFKYVNDLVSFKSIVYLLSLINHFLVFLPKNKENSLYY